MKRNFIARPKNNVHQCAVLDSRRRTALIPKHCIPAFLGFLRDIESPYEVKNHIRLYLGEGKEVQEFAKQFLERRTKWRSAQEAAPLEDDMCVPAPAVNPLNMDFQEVKGKSKKAKKSKMFRVDNRILGFNVMAAQDRINVGDRDYGEM